MNFAALNRQTTPVNLTIEGIWLSKHRPYMSSGARRQLAYDLTTGSAVLCRLIQAQASALTNVCTSSIAAVARQARFPDGRPPKTNEQVERLVLEIGILRVTDALDRLTAPAVIA